MLIVSPTIRIKNSGKGRPNYFATRREEYAQIRFDLDADLSSLFNWNTKQVFLYVLATYPGSTSPTNATTTTVESVIWDAVIPAPQSPYSLAALRDRFMPDPHMRRAQVRAKRAAKDKNKSKGKGTGAGADKNTKKIGVLRLWNQRPKYTITDITGKIGPRSNTSLVVGWNLQPWVGPLAWNRGTNLEKNVGAWDVLGVGFLTGNNAAGRSAPFELPGYEQKNAGTGAAGS